MIHRFLSFKVNFSRLNWPGDEDKQKRTTITVHYQQHPPPADSADRQIVQRGSLTASLEACISYACTLAISELARGDRYSPDALILQSGINYLLLRRQGYAVPVGKGDCICLLQ